MFLGISKASQERPYRPCSGGFLDRRLEKGFRFKFDILYTKNNLVTQCTIKSDIYNRLWEARKKLASPWGLWKVNPPLQKGDWAPEWGPGGRSPRGRRPRSGDPSASASTTFPTIPTFYHTTTTNSTTDDRPTGKRGSERGAILEIHI